MAKLPHNPLEGSQPELVFDLSTDSTDELVSVTVVHKDRPEYLNCCLQSFTNKSINSNYELIVIDQDSGKKSQDFLDAIEQNGVKVIRNKKNTWLSPAYNQGARAASPKAKYFLFMHCDNFILAPNFLDIMIGNSISKNSGLVGVGMPSYELGGQKVQYISDYFFLTSRKCYETCGPFYENELRLIGFSFIYSQSAAMNGFNPIKITQNVVHHEAVSAFSVSEYECMIEEAQPVIVREYSKLLSSRKP